MESDQQKALNRHMQPIKLILLLSDKGANSAKAKKQTNFSVKD